MGPGVKKDLGPRPPASHAYVPLLALCMQGACFLHGPCTCLVSPIPVPAKLKGLLVVSEGLAASLVPS